MIVSNSKKFIFIKPYLVDGKNIEKKLQEYCISKEDVVASLFNFVQKNGNRNTGILNMKKRGAPWYCYVHIPLSVLFPRLNKFYKSDISQKYLTISVIKNPFVLAIDFFWYYTIYWHTYFLNTGSIDKKQIKSVIKANKYYDIAYYYIAGINNHDVIPWFNNWIMSGVLEEKGNHFGISEYLNERFYYENETTKENSINFFIRHEYLNEDIVKLCDLLDIPSFKIKKSISRPHPRYKHLKISDYYNKQTVEYMKRTFRFTIKTGGYLCASDNLSIPQLIDFTVNRKQYSWESTKDNLYCSTRKKYSQKIAKHAWRNYD